jgi:hypothetical protein
VRYCVDKSKVTDDRLEDEVIIINTATGCYYSGSGTAADVWSLVSQGASVAEAAQDLAAAYSCTEQTVLPDVSKCIDFLVDRGLLRLTDLSVPAPELRLPPSIRREWTAPAFDEYTDMWDLIKLDPIHEADEIGWPIAKP